MKSAKVLSPVFPYANTVGTKRCLENISKLSASLSRTAVHHLELFDQFIKFLFSICKVHFLKCLKRKKPRRLYHDEKLSRSPQDLETYLKKINRMLVFNIKLAKKLKTSSSFKIGTSRKKMNRILWRENHIIVSTNANTKNHHHHNGHGSYLFQSSF